MDMHALGLGNVVLATAGFALLNCVFVALQMQTKIVSGVKDGGNFDRFDYSLGNGLYKMGDRTLLNLQEQIVLYLPCMWCYALFCGNAERAGNLGLVWLVFRIFYPLLWSFKGKWNLWVELSTQPSYAICNWYIFHMLRAVLFSATDDWALA